VLAAERRQQIARLLRQQSTVRVEELVDRLDTSESTIRRDLTYLENQGILKRTYGGAVIVDDTQVDTLDPLSTAKMRIGGAAAKLVSQGETVFLGPGTATMAVARHLAQRKSGTVVTNALDIATYLTYHSPLSIILTGGQIERQNTALLGYLAESSLRELRADRAIIGVHGIHLPDGFTGDSLPCVQMMRAVIDVVPEVIVVAEASKWGSSGPALLAPLEAVDVIVTDQKAPPVMIWDLSQLGIKVIQA
jgi:DeoR/GlpR family transcriptional regulator of sugar metabolism